MVITPGFASDCIETLEEVNIEYQDMFKNLGGDNFSAVPCLNDSKQSINLFEHLIDINDWIN